MNRATWDAEAPGSAGSGICDSPEAAQASARAWMRENNAERGEVTEVTLAAAADGIDAGYVRDGRAWEAVRSAEGDVLFRPLADDPPP